ncbi:hypothetical protein SRHO_G00164860 [Serrasalmus rhombeus]
MICTCFIIVFLGMRSLEMQRQKISGRGIVFSFHINAWFSGRRLFLISHEHEKKKTHSFCQWHRTPNRCHETAVGVMLLLRRTWEECHMQNIGTQAIP